MFGQTYPTPHPIKIVSINLSKHKGTRKDQVDRAELIEDFGLKTDAHAGPWHRQISFLSFESIDTVRKQGPDVSSGDFAENITTAGIEICFKFKARKSKGARRTAVR